jgi:hypothetical protein
MAVFKGEFQALSGVGDKYGVAAFGVFRLNVFGFVNV